MSGARRAVAAAVVLVAAIAVYLLVLRSDDDEYTLIFQNAGQLVKGDNVQVGGRAIGSVKAISLTADNQAAIKVSVQAPYAPLHAGTRAVIRLTSLSGIANRYVALTLGPNTNPSLGDGATISSADTTTAVDLDEVFNTLDKRTRGALSGLIKGFSTQYDGKGEQAAQATKYLDPLLSSGSQLASAATQDEGDLTDLIVSTSRAVTAIASKRDDLSQLVGNTDATTGAIASQNRALSQALALLPTTLRRANSTFVNLRSTLDDLDPLVAATQAQTKDLAPFLAQLRPLLDQAQPTLADLATAIRAPGVDNDLVEATRALPGVEQRAKPALRDATGALQKSQPVLEFARPYAPELIGWLRDFGGGAANYDANGHFARVQPIFDAFTVSGDTLVPQAVSQRLSGLQTQIMRRCPGAASQVPPDGSAPFRDADGSLDCDPTEVPPGP